MEYAPLLRRVVAREDLNERDAYEVIGAIADGALSPVQAAGLLAALASKGEHVTEVVGAARAMRERSLHVEHDLPVVADVVGTGGDGANTINISTMAALVVAAAGVPVAKHGNRAASSAFGSADVLEAAGLPLDVDPSVSAKMLADAGFTFLFAQRYHPAMKNVGPIRRELGVRTVFNVLGPLTNPARATHQVVGVSRSGHVRMVGDALRELGLKGAAVVHGYGGIDEIGGDGPADVYSFSGEGVRRWQLHPSDYGVRASRDDLYGGSKDACVDAFNAILAGEKSPRADVVALNAAVALHICDADSTLEGAFEKARAILQSGAALRTFEKAKTVATSPSSRA